MKGYLEPFNKDVLICPNCGARFSKIALLKTRNSTELTIYVWKCSSCRFIFTDYYKFFSGSSWEPYDTYIPYYIFGGNGEWCHLTRLKNI